MKKPAVPKLPTLPKVDFKELAAQFQGLNPNDIGAWPLVPRLSVLAALFLAILVGGWWVLWSDQLNVLDTKSKEEIKLKDEYVIKKGQAINLDLYTQQLNEIDRSFGALLKQLPNKSEVEALLTEINQAGLGRGLQFDLFKPSPETMKDFYAELPIQVKLIGNYHDFGAFAADIGGLSRIVTLGNITVSQVKEGGLLTLEATAKTFRYLDEEELAAQKKAAREAAQKKAGGAAKDAKK
jgi:type IV pilus assembly protein PilO